MLIFIDSPLQILILDNFVSFFFINAAPILAIPDPQGESSLELIDDA